MVWWFFKKGGDSSSEFQQVVKDSFGNIKHDMAQISRWVTHFKEKHEAHEAKFEEILARLNVLESTNLSDFTGGEYEPRLSEKEMEDKWEELTPVQQRLCWTISRLQKENPGRSIPLKEIATEIYPEKKYGDVRSMLSEYMNVLEDFGYVKRIRKGKEARVQFLKENISVPVEHTTLKVAEKKKSKN